MKGKKYFHILILTLAIAWLGGNRAEAQQAVPPPPASHGATGDQAANGGGAPIGGGLFILLGLGAAYGGKKLYDHRKGSLEG